MLKHEVLIIGGGLAGLRTALEAAKRHEAAIISKVHPLRSHSGAAQGGMNAALCNHPEGHDDSPERHTFDTVKGSDYLADQGAARTMCERAPELVWEMEHWGTPFSRFPEGTIAQRPFGGAGFPRTCFAADRTGHVLLDTLYEQVVRQRLRVHVEWLVTRLVVQDGQVAGVIAWDFVNGRFEAVQARAVVMATGGYGRVYLRSTNSIINTGSGIGLAYQAGVPVKDLEFVQFHPTTLVGTNILITEGARGEGGHLYGKDRERFMARYAAEAMELAPRDIVARAMQTEINAGRGARADSMDLELRHLGAERIKLRLPGIRQIAQEFAGVDPIEQPIPVQPGQHYSMGGIATDGTCATAVTGLYAAGECGCASVHGANRLGGNSLLETIVFGKIAGENLPDELPAEPVKGEAALAEALAAEEERLEGLLSGEPGPRVPELRGRMRATMMEQVGIFREERGLKTAVETLRELRAEARDLRSGDQGRKMNQELGDALEFLAVLDVALSTALGALNRTESRGSHYRTDYPERDDQGWLKHTIATPGPEGPELAYSPVDLSIYEPAKRTY